ncbi:MAG: hypothetical protein H6773_00710 [Pseudomonadales bacterium]|nr:hypothetical protein [Candidatus Woesebacteria bacterium]MCB9800680.1 hypothetical protein [Pseudomonadales bacterium]
MENFQIIFWFFVTPILLMGEALKKAWGWWNWTMLFQILLLGIALGYSLIVLIESFVIELLVLLLIQVVGMFLMKSLMTQGYLDRRMLVMLFLSGIFLGGVVLIILV